MVQVFDGVQPNPQNADLFITITPPPQIVGGVPTNVIGRCGTADWGKKNFPQLAGTIAQGSYNYGGKTAAGVLDKYDLATSRELSFAQGPIQIWETRVTDGTDVAAAISLNDTTPTTPLVPLTLTAVCTGTLGNSIKVVIEAGALTNSYNLSLVPFAGGVTEQWRNLLHTGTGANSFWTAAKNAINNGYDGRPASVLVVATNGTDFANGIAPALGTFSLTSGTSGRGVVTADLVGSNSSSPPTGIYSLQNLIPKCSIFSIPGLTDTSVWGSLAALAKNNQMIGVLPFALGTSVSSAISSKKTLGIDSSYVVLLKDHITFYDTVAKQQRTITPDVIFAGTLAALSPHQSPCNKPVSGIVGTEHDGSPSYTVADWSQLEQAGINLICNPIQRGPQYGIRHGRNSSSAEAICPVEHQRMVNYLVDLLGSNLGEFVGENQSELPDDPVRQLITDKGNSLMMDLRDTKKWIQDFSVQCDLNNNAIDAIQRHYCQAHIEAQFLSAIWFFLVGLQGGANVEISVEARRIA